MIKRMLPTLTSLAMLASSGVHAQVADTTGDIFPVVTQKCNLAIQQPDGASGYYLNNTCTAAFILPPSTGTTRVENVDRIANLEMCPGLNKAMKRQVKYEDQIEELVQKLSKDDITEAKSASIRANIQVIRELVKDLYVNYEGVPAASVQVSFTMPSKNEWIGKYLALNPNVGADYRLKFHHVPISDGTLVFSSVTQAKGNVRLSPVVTASVPNMVPSGSSATDFIGQGVVYNGDASGQLVMSLAGICPSSAALEAAKKVESGAAKVDDDKNLTANLVANYTYTVPMMANSSYEGRLDSDMAIRNFVNKWESRTQFSKRDGIDLFSEGSAGVAFHFEVTDYGTGNITAEEKANFEATLRNEVRERLSGALVDQMAMAGLVEMKNAAPDAVSPEPGTVDEVHYRRECRSSSGFLGIGGSSHCWDEPYIIKIPHGAEASVYLSKINNTTFNNRESATINTIVHRVHTGTFLPEKTAGN